MRYNFKDGSIKEVFIIQREESEFWNQRDIEYFMERVHRSLMIPMEFFGNANVDVQEGVRL
jgi:hypothetical protein